MLQICEEIESVHCILLILTKLETPNNFCAWLHILFYNLSHGISHKAFLLTLQITHKFWQIWCVLEVFQNKSVAAVGHFVIKLKNLMFKFKWTWIFSNSATRTSYLTEWICLRLAKWLKFQIVHTSLGKMRIKIIKPLMRIKIIKPLTTKKMHHFPYLEKRARARANLIRQPPENSLVGRCCISDEKPRPFKIILALAGALSASMFWSCAYTSVSWLLSMGSVHLLQQAQYNYHMLTTNQLPDLDIQIIK